MRGGFHTSRSCRSILFALCLCDVLQLRRAQSQEGVTLSPGVFQEISLSPKDSVAISCSGIPEGTAFSIIHAHAVFANITISYTSTLTTGQYATGSNVGLALNGSDATTVYLTPTNSSNEAPLSVLLLLQSYGTNAPIPGGCNMELPVKTAPYLPSTFTPNIVTVQYPLGSWPLNVRPATCDRAPLQYDIFIYYLPERDFSVKAAFDGLRLMSNATSVEKFGTKVNFYGIPPSELKFANYVGTGRIVAILLRSLTDSAAYVPTLSYGCDLTSENSESNCDVLGSTGSKLLSAGLVFAGLFLITLGHRYYKCQLFLFGFLVSALVFYVVFMLTISIGSSATMTAALVCGAVGGAAWVMIWAQCGTPIGPVFLASFILGTLFAAIVSFTPLVDLSVMKDDLTYWLSFFCLVLAVPLVIISFDKLTSIAVSCIVGAYIFTAPVDHYVGSNLKYIFLNVIRRATDSEFSSAVIQPPYQYLDVILTVTWGILALIGLAFQLWRERDRPPFPPAPGPWNWPPSSRREERLNNETEADPFFQNANNGNISIPIPTERTPLISR